MTLSEIARKEGLEVVTTTSKRSGYPRFPADALIGFNSFDQAVALATIYNMTVVILHKRDGHQFWYNNREEILVPPRLEPEDVGYYLEYDSHTTEEDLLDELKAQIDGLDSIEDIMDLASAKLSLLGEIENLEDDWVVFANTLDGNTKAFEKFPKHPTQWSYDTHYYAIAIY